jgi:hypothetical protein
MLSLASTKADGLIVQVLPYEWVSRPSVGAIRKYIRDNKWSVAVYRLPDGQFSDVLTAASITVIDKAGDGSWAYYEIGSAGDVKSLPGIAGRVDDIIRYSRASGSVFARRGLSPGTQRLLTLTEGERVHAGLHIGTDVVRCVTSLRGIPGEVTELTGDAFDQFYRQQGAKCWLVRPTGDPSDRLGAYLDGCSPKDRDTATCRDRDQWWRFNMPETPTLLISQAFKGTSPKSVVNSCRVKAVGGVCGIHGLDDAGGFKACLDRLDLSGRLVPYAKDLLKVEIGQLNTLLLDFVGD